MWLLSSNVTSSPEPHDDDDDDDDDDDASHNFSHRQMTYNTFHRGHNNKNNMDVVNLSRSHEEEENGTKVIDDKEVFVQGETSAPPTEWKKYSSYHVKVDPNQDDKAMEIRLRSFARPHMRAFHCSWAGFFMAFFIWFAIAPLLPEIKKSIGITKKDVWTSNIVGVGGTILMRFLLGPLCDKFGARTLFAITLCVASIPTACLGFVNSAIGLTVLRLFIGMAGGTFVMCQYWSSRMFTKEVVGTANALVGGWGNLGGGVTQLVVGSMLFPLFKLIYGGDAEKAWRTVTVVPAVVSFGCGIAMYYISDDAPKGNYDELKLHGNMPPVSAAASFRTGTANLNTWLLFLQYACCFGVELTMNNAAASYFEDIFDKKTEEAAAIASIFGWMNLFARGLGGYVSDLMNARMGMRGRLLTQTILLAFEGALVLLFAQTNTLGSSILVMILFSLFVQAAEGSTYGIVPYVDGPNTGSIAGIVGAGGNTGAVCFGLGFRQLEYKPAFMIMGFSILASAFLSFLINIEGHSSLLWGNEVGDDKDTPTASFAKLFVPVKDKETQQEDNEDGDDDDDDA